ncbi:hypothetical protein [Streptomyces sp. NPDC059072]|uniref:hypothetical protein n=1 Tax=Streptomyces sp. NPDC059072 TaxID=3346715 RepID=UPI0036A2A017
MNREIPQSAASSATPRTPFQAPAVDRSPTAPARADTGAPGVEANWEVPWTLLGQVTKGALDAWLASRA